MFKVNVIAVGKVKEKYFLDAINEYAKRLSRFCEFNIIEVKEENFNAVPSLGDKEKILKREGDDILAKCRGKIVAMCVEGKGVSSEDFAKMLKECESRGEEMTFVIGGSYGLSAEVKARAKDKISFSDMTFPHTLFRVMLTEQIYRAFMINAGSEYHK